MDFNIYPATVRDQQHHHNEGNLPTARVETTKPIFCSDRNASFYCLSDTFSNKPFLSFFWHVTMLPMGGMQSMLYFSKFLIKIYLWQDAFKFVANSRAGCTVTVTYHTKSDCVTCCGLPILNYTWAFYYPQPLGRFCARAPVHKESLEATAI